MTAWRSATLTDDDYVRGQLPLPGWPSGEASLRLPTAETIRIIVEGGRGIGAALFVWNFLGPSLSIEIVAPHNGFPGRVRLLPAPPETPGRQIQAAAEAPLGPADTRNTVWELTERAIDWMGPGASFENVWAYLSHRGVRLSPQTLVSIIAERFLIDDDGLITNCCESVLDIDPPGVALFWDPVEQAYWELLGETEPPLLDRTHRKRRSSVTDGLEYHLDEIRHSLLTAEDEQRLGSAIQEGIEAELELHGVDSEDRERRGELGWAIHRADEARDEFAQRNLRLVFSIAKRYLWQIEDLTLDLGDLIQAGYLGLLRAVEKYDPTRGTKFSTYATWWIKQAVTRHIADYGRTIRLPVHLHDKVLRIGRELWRYRQTHGREPSAEELADQCGLTAEETTRIGGYSALPSSYEELVSSGLGDLIEDPDVDDLADLAWEGIARSMVLEAVGDLDDRERRIIELRFGLLDGRDRTLEEVGQEFGLTRERIRQLQKLGLGSLRQSRHLRSALGRSTYELSAESDRPDD